MIRSANSFFGFFINAKTIAQGKLPRTRNRIIPGIKKLLKGEFSNSDKGIPNNFPSGEIINTPPPKTAPLPRNANKKRRIFRAVFDFIIF